MEADEVEVVDLMVLFDSHVWFFSRIDGVVKLLLKFTSAIVFFNKVVAAAVFVDDNDDDDDGDDDDDSAWLCCPVLPPKSKWPPSLVSLATRTCSAEIRKTRHRD